MYNIQMVDLKSQYLKIKNEIDYAIAEVINSSQFIKGSKFEQFQTELGKFLNVENIIACGNGTDALQIAIMALDLKPGDEVIIPAFTYVATAEVIGLLGLIPVLVDVDLSTFNILPEEILKAISPKTKLIVPVHLFGQCADMASILEIAQNNNIFVIEDAAQALGAEYVFKSGVKLKAGCIGDIGCASFFPSKNLGCFGDGGAMITNNIDYAKKLKMIANHGQIIQYEHEIVGLNSRLDNIQAAILLKKLNYLEEYNKSRQDVADFYDLALSNVEQLEIPYRNNKSTHVFNQYTLKINGGKRNSLKEYLKKFQIPSMIYYPKPLHFQKAYCNLGRKVGPLANAEKLCEEVLSLPIHTEMKPEQLHYIAEKIESFFNGK